MNPQAVVVGSGLAGLTATIQLLNKGISVVIVEKSSKFGGNSVKASSGINGVLTTFQKQQNIKDSVESFRKDTLKSGNGLLDPDLVEVLVLRSREAIDWLSESEYGNNVDLSAISQLGGHSYPRTHRGSGKLPPGYAIISALERSIKNVEKLQLPNLQILKETSLTKILTDKNHKVIGIQYTTAENTGEKKLLAQNVVLATGGYSADFEGSLSLLAKYRPDLLNFPLTNAVGTTGDGQKIAHRDVNAKYVHMNKIQVHPTGFIKVGQNTTGEKFKFLCGELVRGIGGVLISPQGTRFVDELTTRDVVTSAIEDHCDAHANTLQIPTHQKVAVVALTHKDYLKAPSHIDFYLSQKLMYKSSFEGLKNALRDLNPDFNDETLLLTFKKYNDAVDQENDEVGRKVFGNQFDISPEAELYYGFVTPVIHFTMGGISINENAQVINENGTVVDNLFAVGEVSGGLHGHNRLGGNSLLECVVFGTVAAESIYNNINSST